MDHVIVTAFLLKLVFGLAACGMGAATLRSRRLAESRIQTASELPNWSEFHRRTRRTLLNLAMILGLIILSSPVAKFVTTDLGLAAGLAQLGILVVGVDLYEYLIHRLMHRNRWLWERIHRRHHEVDSPLASDYLYVHPAEALGVGAGFVVVGTLCVLVFGVLCGWSLWVWALIRLTHAVDSHSGLRSRILPRLPLMAEAEHHDLHHSSARSGNYGSLTTIWDGMLGTRIAQPGSAAQAAHGPG